MKIKAIDYKIRGVSQKDIKEANEMINLINNYLSKNKDESAYNYIKGTSDFYAFCVRMNDIIKTRKLK